MGDDGGNVTKLGGLKKKRPTCFLSENLNPIPSHPGKL